MTQVASVKVRVEPQCGKQCREARRKKSNGRVGRSPDAHGRRTRTSLIFCCRRARHERVVFFCSFRLNVHCECCCFFSQCCVCLLQLSRFLSSRMGCSSQGVMGDLYGYYE